MNPACPYCGEDAAPVTGQEIYPHRADLWEKRFFLCKPCGAYVGCHPDGKPLGRLANAALRKAKQKAHAAFDPLWRSGKMKRSHAYSWLAKQLGIPKEKTHIGGFDEAMCAKVLEACK